MGWRVREAIGRVKVMNEKERGREVDGDTGEAADEERKGRVERG